MLIFQKLDTEYINEIIEEIKLFKQIRNKQIFDNNCEETITLLRKELKREVNEYHKNYGIDFKSGKRISAKTEGNTSGARGQAGDASQIFA